MTCQELIEQLVSRTWCEICGYDTVDPNADFFELGGNSLEAVEVVMRLQPILGEEIQLLAIFFENPTVSAIATAIVESLTPEEIEVLSARLVNGAG